MDMPKLKKGTIRKVADDHITLFNMDGHCEDTFPVYPDFADQIRGNIKSAEAVFYVTEGNDLVGIGLEEAAPPELKKLYQSWPKEKECTFWENKQEN